MNKVILIGRLTRDPEIRYTQTGKAVCDFSLAVDRPFTSNSGEREADFINIVVWNKPAENVAKYLAKGRQCAVEGRLQIRSYEGNDGVRKYRTEVIANSVEFLGSNSSSQPRESYNNYTDNGIQNDFNSSPSGEEVFFADEDLPF